MNKLEKILSISVIIGIFGITSIGITFATTESELKTKKNSIDEQIAETNSEIAGVKSQMTNTLTQINQLNSQISSYESEIDELEGQLSTLDVQIEKKEENILEQEAKYKEQKELDVQIEKKEENILEQEAKYKEQKELLEKRLVALYESGTISYLDVLLSAETLSDFISKYYMISQIAELDEELLQNIENTRNKIQTEKEELENSKKALASSKETIEVKRNSLNLSVKDKNNLVSTLTEEEKALNKQLEQFEADKKAIQDELGKIAKKESSKNSSSTVVSNVTPSSCGYIFPISGLSKGNINNKNYPSYPGHNGVDVNIGVVGKSVVAVKDGTVETSKSLKNPDGSYRSYGEYITINHHDGTQTLYAHLLAGSRKVSPGQKVSQGQVIGTVGSTGNSTGPHLHFGVYINDKRSFVNPLPYLP